MALSAYNSTTKQFVDGSPLNQDDLNTSKADERAAALPSAATNLLYGGSGAAGTAQAVSVAAPATLSSGNLGVRTATVNQTGVVQPDGTTITISGGVISAASVAPESYQETTYTASGAIAVADDTAVFNSASALTMTLGSGATPGHTMILKQFNAGTVIISLVLDGSSRSMTLNPANPPLNDALNIRWSAARNSWLAF